MDDIVGVITSVEDDEYQGKTHKKVTLGTGQVLKVKQGRDGALMAKWGLLQEGVAFVFKMEEYTNPKGVKFPFVQDVVKVADELQPPTKPIQPIDPNQPEIDKAFKKEPAPQELGMWWKEVGEMIRAGMIKNTGATAVYWKAYWLQMSNVLGVRAQGDKNG